MIWILVLEFVLITATGVIQEFIHPAIGSLVVAVFSMYFIVIGVAAGKDKDA